MMKPPLPLEREALASTPSFRRNPNEVCPELDESSALAASSAGSPQEIPAIDSPRGRQASVPPFEGGHGGGDDDDDGSDEFEFAVLSGDSFEGLEPISADDIFSNGRILPIYPLFSRALVLDDAGFRHRDGEDHRADRAGAEEAGKTARLPLRRLLMEERDAPSTSSSESDELDGIPAESYCVWTPSSVPPSPDLSRRSHSTGDSSSKRWRLRDLVIGRSQSDGRKKFLFLTAPPHTPSAEKASRRPSSDGHPAAAEEEKKKGKGKGGVRVREMDMVTAHRLYYGKGGAAAGDRRRSFLPYRKDLVGFVGNVNGPFQHHAF